MTSVDARESLSNIGSPQSRVSAWMTKALAIVLGSYALFSCWALFYRVSPIAIASACVFGAATVGLWLRRPWSRWIVYSISALLCVWFVWYVSKLVQGGWPYDDGTSSDGTRSVMAVLPAALLLLGGIAAAAHVRRVFNR